MCSTWLPTVLGLMPSADAIALFEQPLREQPEHVGFAGGEPGGSRRRAAGRHVAGRGEHRVDRIAVEPARVDLGPQLTRRVLGVERSAVRARLRHRVVRVGGGEQARRASRASVPPTPRW